MKRVLVILVFIFGCCAFSFARQRDSSVLASGHFEYPQKLTTWDGEPLTRDGGQQLGRKFQLYDMTSDRSVNFR